MKKLNRETITLQDKITELFKQYIVKRPSGNCQVLFALTEIDGLVDKILEKIKEK